jgi:hypothetical protein
MQKSGFRGQGTIEYLVIIAVVIVLALAASFFMFSSMGSASQADKASLKAAWQSKEVGIADFAVNPDGNGEIAIMNNTTGIARIKKVYVNGVLTFDGTLALSQFDKFTIGSFSGAVTPCTSDIRYNIKIIYESESGLEQTVEGDLYAECIPNFLVNGFFSLGAGVDFNSAVSGNVNISDGNYALLDTNVFNSVVLDNISDSSVVDSNTSHGGGQVILGQAS